MFALETEQSGGKLLHHSDLRGGFLEETSRSTQREKKIGKEAEGVWEHGVEENIWT